MIISTSSKSEISSIYLSILIVPIRYCSALYLPKSPMSKILEYRLVVLLLYFYYRQLYCITNLFIGFNLSGEKQAKEAQDQIMLQKTTTSQPKKYSRIIVVPVNLPLTYGTHHTKMMILQSEGGIRVVIHTANLIMVDWTVKTQGVWVSPLCPLIPECDQIADAVDSDCLSFKSYLLKYLSEYKTSATDQLNRILMKYDMSGITQVKLVGSIPGMHTCSLYGTLRLQKLLSLFVDDTKVRPGWRIVANCSSIGSLGQSTADWFDKFVRALQTTNRSQEVSRQALFQLVFPTVEMIRNSLEGMHLVN